MIKIKKYKNAFIFLIAYFLYIDGVGTIIKMAVAFGNDMGIQMHILLLVLLAIQFVGFPFTLLYGKLAKKTSAKTMIFIGICIYIILTVVGFFIQFVKDQNSAVIIFIIMSLLVASSQGGIQALSRSFFGKLIPRESSAEFFGFYNIFGKFAAILGPLMYGVITKITQNSGIGIISIIFLFISGGSVLYFVKDN